MTDLTRPADVLTVEERLALLEARLNPVPQAVVPPITIGSLNNVPVPGGQIAAQWAQDVTSIALHRFASKASLDGWAAPNGAFALTTDLGVYWTRNGGAWCRFSPLALSAVGITSNSQAPGALTVCTLNIPADQGPRVAVVSHFLRIDAYYARRIFIDLVMDGTVLSRSGTKPQTSSTIPDLFPQINISQTLNYNINAGAAAVATVVVTNDGTGSGAHYTVAGDAMSNRINATVHPRAGF